MNMAAVIAVNRFGLGARPGDLERAARDPKSWLLDQLQGASRTPSELQRLGNSADVLVEIQQLRQERRMERQQSAAEVSVDPVGRYGQAVRRHYLDQTAARYRVAAQTELPFYERLVHFWANHFAVSADKQPIPALAGLYENEAIRPNICGRFADLLLAAEQHPAMILYLDNQRSVGPNSPAGRHANRGGNERKVGLNENLAREILELHTLGVDGGYSQDDVTAFAAVITGWSIGGAAEGGRFADGVPGKFCFRDVIHEPGNKTILGKTYSQRGLAQGDAVLRDLAVHPATGRFLATKLARHFVADEPPPRLVDALSGSYLDSGGDLAAVYATLVGADESLVGGTGKYKSPDDFLVSAYRAFGQSPRDARLVFGALETMGQAPYRPGSPAGWPDTAGEWGGADALYKRIEWSDTVARVAANRVDPVALGEAVLGPAFTAATRLAVSRAESLAQGTTLLLASPDFQRR